MKNNKYKKIYYFVDETGDPTFYDRKGRLIIGEKSSSILGLGFIRTEDPNTMRKSLKVLKDEIKGDDYLKSIPSWEKTCKAFHAKDDCAEVREKVFKLIKNLDFKSQFVIARKVETVFKGKKINSSEEAFYSNLISKLFENRLHLAEENIIYLQKGGTKINRSI